MAIGQFTYTVQLKFKKIISFTFLLFFIVCIGGIESLQARTDTVHIGMVLEPPHLDPTAGAAGAIDEIVYTNIFEGLTRINEEGEVVPALAKSWKANADLTEYTFTLQENVVFHNNAIFDSEDVVFSLNRMRKPNSVNAQKSLLKHVKSVQAIDSHTVKITLTQPDSNFPYILSWGDCVIVDKDSAKSNKNHPIGTGAFRFVNWQKGKKVRLEKFGAYWGQPLQIERADFHFISDPAAAIAAVLSKRIDAFPNFPAPEALENFKKNSDFEVVIGSTQGETIVAINNADPILKDINVRRALQHATNKDSIIEAVTLGYAQPIGSHMSPHDPAYVDLSQKYAYDPQKATTLLSQNNIVIRELSLKLPPPSYARRSGEILQAQFMQIGIQLNITYMEWGQWLEEVFRNKNYQLTIIAHTEPNDINIYAKDSYYFQYNNTQFRKIIDKISTESDLSKRKLLYKIAQEILAEDAVNIFLFQLPKYGVWNKKLKGLWHNSPLQANVLTQTYWVP